MGITTLDEYVVQEGYGRTPIYIIIMGIITLDEYVVILLL